MATWFVPTNFPTIQAAVNGAGVGDTIIVEASYANTNENVSVTVNNLTFDGPSGTATVLFTLSAGIAAITLTGNANFRVTGNTSDNSITGNSGANILNGNEGSDTIFGGSGNDTITGDTIATNAGNDVLRGEDGDDTISDQFGTVADIDGGAGNDTVTIGSTFTSGTVAGGADSDILAMAASANLSLLSINGFETLYTQGSTVTATAAQFDAFDTIAYNAANPGATVSLVLAASGQFLLDLSDELNSGGPHGINLTGSTNDEHVILGDGADTVNAGNGDDTIDAMSGNDIVNGDAGDDQINGFSGNDTLRGGQGNDSISGGIGDDIIEGDSISTNAGNDTIGGGDGNDLITDNFGTVADIDGGSGNDAIAISNSFTSGTVAGGADIDTLTLNNSVNLSLLTIIGMERLETSGTLATATAAQFEAFDRISYNAGNPTIAVSLQIAATGGATTLDISSELSDGGLRAATVTGSSDSETITTGDASDTISAGLGDDILNGGAGNDTLNGNEGNDQIFGGIGNDTISGDTIATNAGNDVLRGEDGNDTITDNFGTVADIDGGSGNDSIAISNSFTSGTVAGGADIDTLSMNASVNLSLLTITGFERLNTVGTLVTATAAQFEAFDRISYNAGNLTAIVSLQLAATGSATTLDISSELSDGGLRAATVTGSSDSETITTGDGSDTINAGLGDDIVNGGASNDILNGNEGNDQIFGGIGNDTISGDLNGTNAGNDILRGEDGDDVITDSFGTIADIDGGIGNDTVGVTTNFLSGTIAGGADIDTLSMSGNVNLSLLTVSGFERLFTVGSLITATAAQFESFDRITYNANNPTIGVNLRLAATGGPTVLDLAGELSDGGVRAVTLTGSSDDETITTGDASDTINAGLGNDRLIGGLGNDLLDGGGGIDTADYSAAAGIINIDLRNTASFQNTVSAGNDRLTGIENVIGSAFDDELISDLAIINELRGGAGNDRYYIYQFGDQAIEAAGEGTADRIDAFANVSLLATSEIETIVARLTTDMTLGGSDTANLMNGNTGNDTLNGNGGNDTLNGLDGNDTLDGGAGNDTLDGGAGNDLINGGANIDTITYAAATGGVTLSLLLTAAQNTGGAGTDTVTNVENIVGSGHADDFTGTNGVNIISGGGGNDTINARGGADTMSGGSGDDKYYVDNLGDIVNELAGQGSDRVYASVNYTLGAAQAIEFLYANAGATGLTLTGNELANNVQGNAGVDTLFGMDGADTLDGRGGADDMTGGIGNDKYYVDNAGDVLHEGAAEGTLDIAYASVSYVLGAGVYVERLYADSSSGLTLQGNELANALFGGSGNDTLMGHDGADTLTGNSGNDRLIGGTGIDTLFGNAGADVFVLQNLAVDRDTIRDFEAADQIEVSAALFGGGLVAGSLAANQFVSNGTGLAGDSDDRFVYNNSTGALYFDEDGDGATARVQIVTLTGMPSLSAGDFNIVA